MHWIAGILVVCGEILLPLAAHSQTTSKSFTPVHKAVAHASGSSTAAKASGARANATGKAGTSAKGSIKHGSAGASSRARGRRGHSTTRARRSTAPSYQLHPDPERYQQIQQSLADRGFYKGQPDGTWNDDSVQALRSFQTANQLDADGKISALTLMKLGLGPKHDGSAAPLSSASGAHPDAAVPAPDASATETSLPPPPTSLPPETQTERTPQ